MQIVITQRPNRYSFSKNPLIWKFAVDNPAAPGCQVEVKISTQTLPAKTYQIQIKPSVVDGSAVFNLQDIIDSMIDFQVPVFNVNPIVAATNFMTVSFLYRVITDDDSDPAWNSDADEAWARFVVKGGIELLKYDYNNYFLNYQAGNKPFATWQPKNRFIGIKDDFWMSILFTNPDVSIDSTARKLKVFIEWTDGTNDTVYHAFTTDPSSVFPYHGLYHISAGPKNLFDEPTLSAGRLLYRYSLQVVGDVDESILFSEAYTLYADHRVFYNSKTFNYFNSLGGIDHVRILGDTDNNYSRGFTESEMFSSFAIIGTPADKQYIQSNHTRLNTVKSDAGYRHTKLEIDALQEILTSGFIWEIKDNSNTYRTIYILNKNAKLFSASDKRWNFPLEWRYAFTEQVYTPDIDFGKGLDGQTYTGFVCATPTGLSNLSGVTEEGNKYFSIGWYLITDVTFTFQYKLAADSVWTDPPPEYEGNIFYSKFFFPAGTGAGTYNWRVKTICGLGNESAWVNGSDIVIP